MIRNYFRCVECKKYFAENDDDICAVHQKDQNILYYCQECFLKHKHAKEES